MTMLKTGDKAPNFSLIDQDGKKVKLADFKGKKLLLYLLSESQHIGVNEAGRQRT